MSTRFVILACLGLALIAGTTSYIITSNRQRSGDSRAANETAPQTSIRLYSDRAVPDAIILKVGETATFASADSTSHSLSLGGGAHGLSAGSREDGHAHQHVGDFTSGEFASDEAWQVTFRTAGTYEFHDHLHPEVRITVVAYQPEQP